MNFRIASLGLLCFAVMHGSHIAKSATYTTSITISPAYPSASWNPVLLPDESAQLTIFVELDGVVDEEQFTLDGKPALTFIQTDPDFAWTEDGEVFTITNSIKKPAAATVLV